jgi:hypothetical protein
MFASSSLLEGVGDLLVVLAHSGEDALLGVGPHLQRPVELAARDHVEAAPLVLHQLEDGEVGVGLDGVADQRGLGQAAGAREGVPQLSVVLQDRPAGIDVDRRPVLLGDVLDGDVLDLQVAAGVAEVVHSGIRRGPSSKIEQPEPVLPPLSHPGRGRIIGGRAPGGK